MTDHSAIELRPKMVRMSDVEPKDIEWLWPGRIPIGKVSILSGSPDKGKSLVTLDIASRVTTGRKWPDCAESPKTGGVIIVGVEDDLADTVRPRLDANGADVSRIQALDAILQADGSESLLNLDKNIAQLEAAISEQGDCRLVIIDPIGAFMGNKDSNKDSDVRAITAPLARLAVKYRVAILLVAHLNKGKADTALNKSMGSVGFGASVRAVWFVADDKEKEGRKLFLRGKCNVSANNGGLAYSIHCAPGANAPVVAWESGRVDISADDALLDNRSARGPKPESRQEAEEFLKEILVSGSVASKIVIDEAKRRGIAIATLDRAKRDLKVKSHRAGDCWFMRLPKSEDNRERTSLQINAPPFEWGAAAYPWVEPKPRLAWGF